MALVPVVVVWVLAAVTLSGRPWRDTPMNPTLAIDRGDFAQAIRAIEAGASASAAYPHPTPLAPDRRVTPIDEAIRAGEPDLVKLLLDFGALADTAARRRTVCRVAATGDRAMAAVLAGGHVSDGSCPSVSQVLP